MPVVTMVGGGQLARMTHQSAIALGQCLRVLAASEDDPAAQVSADVVIGSRWVPGGQVVNWPRRRKALSLGANAYTRLWLGMPVRDATAGFRLGEFRRFG